MIKIVCKKCAKLLARDDFYQTKGTAIQEMTCLDCCRTIVKDDLCYIEINGETKEPYTKIIRKYIRELK